jgi:hypothetical protein
MSNPLDVAIDGLGAAMQALQQMRGGQQPPPSPQPQQDFDYDEPADPVASRSPAGDPTPADVILGAKSPAMAVANLVGYLVEHPGEYIVVQGDKLVFRYAGYEQDQELQQTRRHQNQTWGSAGGKVV